MISAIFSALVTMLPPTASAEENPFLGIMQKIQSLKKNGEASLSIDQALQKVQSGKDTENQAGKLIFSSARQGNPAACNAVGWMFDNGKEVKQDSAKALRWFESCALKNGPASYNAGVLYFEGRGTIKDDDKAAKYLAQSWKLDTKKPQIAIRLAFHFYSKNMNQVAWTWAQKAADKDSGYGKYIAAKLIINHASPYEDKSKALEYLNTAMESYIPPAAEMLAWAYGTGYGIDQNTGMAYTMSIVSASMRNHQAFSSRWSNGMSDEDKRKSEADASRWMQTHKIPDSRLDFVSTVPR